MKNFVLGSLSTIVFSWFLYGCIKGVGYGSDIRSGVQ